MFLHPSLRGVPCGDGSGRHSLVPDISTVQILALSVPLLSAFLDPGMSLNCAPTWVCRKSASRPGYVVKVRPHPVYVVKQCPRIVMNKIFDWH